MRLVAEKYANKIHEQGGQYFLALKNNQKTLITDVEYLFTKPELFSDQYDEVDSGLEESI